VINFDTNNLKPYLTSVAVVVRGLGSALYPWSYVGTASTCYIFAPDPEVMPIS